MDKQKIIMLPTTRFHRAPRVLLVSMTTTMIMMMMIMFQSVFGDDSNHMTIHFAAQQDQPTLILEAISNGEDINKIGPGGQTPLMYAGEYLIHHSRDLCQKAHLIIYLISSVSAK
jgi:hypothetical protein